MKSILYLLLLLLGLSSCQPNYVLNEEQVILEDHWTYDEIKSFDLNISNLEDIYDLNLIITHNKEYSYENIYMKIHTHFPSIEKKSEQITIQLADKKGQWLGKCKGEECMIKVYLLEGFKFPEVGDYTFSFEQFTRDESLKGIKKLTLQVFPSDK